MQLKGSLKRIFLVLKLLLIVFPPLENNLLFTKLTSYYIIFSAFLKHQLHVQSSLMPFENIPSQLDKKRNKTKFRKSCSFYFSSEVPVPAPVPVTPETATGRKMRDCRKFIHYEFSPPFVSDESSTDQFSPVLKAKMQENTEIGKKKGKQGGKKKMETEKKKGKTGKGKNLNADFSIRYV